MTKTLKVGTVLALLLAAGACAKTDETAAGDRPGTGFPSDDVVALRVENIGGFVTPTILVTRLPSITVYGDGRVYTEGPIPAIFPGPALPNLQMQRISTGGVDKLTAKATEAGVGTLGDLGQPSITDVPSTRFTVWTPTGVKTLEVQALVEGAGHDSGLTSEQKAGRKRLLDLVAALSDLPGTLGADASGKSEPVTPTALAAVATPWMPGGDEVAAPEVAWPGPALPGDAIGGGVTLGCVTATGDTAAAVVAAAAKATAITPWVSGGKKWTVLFRPLLPGEKGCADLAPKA